MPRILIAEDDPASRELLWELLTAYDYSVIETSNGQEALQKIHEERPDLVLLDIQMPVLDGLEVVRRLRNDARFLDLPVVALSAYAMRGDHDNGLNAGFNAYLTKPIDAAALRSEIERLLA